MIQSHSNTAEFDHPIVYKVPAIFQELSGLAAGFFGRQGGVSKPPYESLNAAWYVGDDPAHVMVNARRIMKALGAPYGTLVLTRQVHSCDVIRISTLPSRAPFIGDAMTTGLRKIFLGVLTADCVPVLAVDPCGEVIGACHIGWKGACGGILDRFMESLQDQGAHLRHLRVALGPCISLVRYQVQEDLYLSFKKAYGSFCSPFFVRNKNRFYFDIGAFVEASLKKYPLAAIERSGNNDEEKTYFSYRHACAQGMNVCGRNLSVIGWL